MKKYFILLLCLASFTSYSQTKDYYRKEGVIPTTATRSSDSDQYVCELFTARLSRIYNSKNKLKGKVPLKKNGEEGDLYATQVVLEDPAIFCKIIGPLIQKHSLEIYDHGTDRSQIKKFINSLRLHVYYDSTTSEVLEVVFTFLNKVEFYASHIPIETYIEIEKEIKKRVKVTVTEEGKSRVFCTSGMVMIFFKPKPN